MSASLYEARDFASFWADYEELHADPRVQDLHLLATAALLALGAAGVLARSPALLAAAPLADYAIAQASHRGLQRVRTQPYRRLPWHFRAELRLARRTLTRHLARGRRQARRSRPETGGEPCNE